jgi:hypothetical protein
VDKVIVLGAKPYDFTDEETGQRKTGATVHFLVPDQDDPNSVGYIPKKTSVSMEVYESMKELQYPFEAEVVLENVFTSRGVRARVQSFEYLASLQFS